MLTIVDIVFFIFIFIIISNPIMYKFTNKLMFNYLNIINSKNIPTLLGIIVHSLIFAITVYFYLQSKEHFNELCPPGYKYLKPDNSVYDPMKSWCTLDTKSGNSNENNNEKDEEEEENKDTTLCQDGYSSTKESSYNTNTKSWCKKNNDIN